VVVRNNDREECDADDKHAAVADDEDDEEEDVIDQRRVNTVRRTAQKSKQRYQM